MKNKFFKGIALLFTSTIACFSTTLISTSLATKTTTHSCELININKSSLSAVQKINFDSDYKFENLVFNINTQITTTNLSQHVVDQDGEKVTDGLYFYLKGNSLPDTLNFNSNTGQISGKPTKAQEINNLWIEVRYNGSSSITAKSNTFNIKIIIDTLPWWIYVAIAGSLLFIFSLFAFIALISRKSKEKKIKKINAANRPVEVPPLNKWKRKKTKDSYKREF